MYRYNSGEWVANFGLITGIIGLVIGIVSTFYAYQANVLAQQANLIAYQAKLEIEQANSAIERANLAVEQASLAAEQANVLATQANDVAQINEVIRQVTLLNRSLSRILSTCYQAYNESKHDEALVVGALQENCNLAKLANAMSLLSDHNFQALLALQDEACVTSFTAISTLVDTAIREDNYTYLITIFDQSSALSPVVVEPAPEISYVLGCFDNINSVEIHDFYSEMFINEAIND